MDIWDWLDPWWAWWAGLTGLFNWDAIGAIGTTAGFVAAVWVASMAIQDRRMRDAAVVLAASHPMVTAAKLIQHCLDTASTTPEPRLAFQTMLDTGLLEQHAANLESFSLLTLPSARAVDPFVAGKACITGLPIMLRASLAKGGEAITSLPETLMQVRDRLNECAAALRDESERIQRKGGPF